MLKSSRFNFDNYSRVPVLSVSFAALFIIGSIVLSTHSLLAFVSLEGLVIVVGGVIATAFMSFDTIEVKKALDAIVALFKKPDDAAQNSLRVDIAVMVSWAHLVKEKGMRSLESALAKRGVADPFVKYGLNMVVSKYTPEDVRAMMETAADAKFERDNVPVDILQAMTSHAPAFGMIGTLVGMIAMLCNLNGHLDNIGPSLSVSFLSTLYGVVSARMVYMPAAAKLRQAVMQRHYRSHLIIEGMVMLASDKSAMHMQDRLNSFLRPELHNYIDFLGTRTVPVSSPVPLQPQPHLRTVSA